MAAVIVGVRFQGNRVGGKLMSNESQDQGLESLISAWLDGRISAEQSELLQRELRESEEARKQFLRYSRLDASLRQLIDTKSAQQLTAAVESGESVEVKTNSNAANTEWKSKRWSSLSVATIAVCATLLLSFLISALRNEPEPSVASISGLSGPFRWTGDGGRVTTDLSVGQKLTGGTIDGLSPESWFELRFDDGTSLTLSGNSMLTFADDGQKVLHLKSGKLSAAVKKQTRGSPMLVHTRSATLTVLGTSFEVDADLPTTSVKVSEGSVRVARTSDGKAVDVPANHRVVAAADRELRQIVLSGYVETWKSELHLGPSETFGEWVAASDAEPAMLKSIAFVPEEAPSVVLYLLGMGMNSVDAPIRLSAGSEFTIQGKLDFATEVYLGFSVNKDDGEFAGKFLTKCAPRRDESGNFVATARLEEFGLDPTFQKYKDKLPSSPERLLLTGIWCFTHSKEASGLRVSQIELTPQQTSQATQD